ncbi:MAG: 3'(2'),5'-bisphosphate nucleotidase [Planctomycetes bacterium]|nr:3'(2'),5'-bisphosphate nucleotidase [Planctomycetota bacterium]
MTPSNSYQIESARAMKALLKAADFCQAVQADFTGESQIDKKDKSPVTVADYGVQAILGRALGEAFPADSMIAEEHSQELLAAKGEGLCKRLLGIWKSCLGEEPGLADLAAWIDWGAGNPAGRQWVLDPVDGTKGFLRAEQYALALSLLVDGIIELGFLVCPNLVWKDGKRGCIFHARRGAGASLAWLGEPEETEVITVSAEAAGSELVLVESFESGHCNHALQDTLRRKLGISRAALRMDSQAKYGVVARGMASAYLRLPSPETPDYREKIWDHAAGALLVEEAGGRVTDIYGQALDFTLGERLLQNQGIVATNGACHNLVIDAIAESLGSTP